MRRGIFLRLFQACRLCLASAFRHRFGEVGEQYGHEQHHADNDVIYPEIAGCYIAKQTWKERKQQSDKAAYFHHEHHRIFHHISWIQLYKGTDDRLMEDFRRYQFFCLFFTHIRFASLRP